MNANTKINKRILLAFAKMLISIAVLLGSIFVLTYVSKAWFSQNDQIKTNGIALHVIESTSMTYRMYKLEETVGGSVVIDDVNYEWQEIASIALDENLPNETSRYKILVSGITIDGLNITIDATTEDIENFDYYYLKLLSAENAEFTDYTNLDVSDISMYDTADAQGLVTDDVMSGVYYDVVETGTYEMFFDIYLHKDASNDISEWEVSGQAAVVTE